MKVLTGKPVAPGYAEGHAVILGVTRQDLVARELGPDEVGGELARFHAALESSRRELQQLRARVESELGPASADIFSAHLSFLNDQQFIDRIEDRIISERQGLESAIQATTDDIANVLGEADDVYLRDRAADVRDLHRRLIRHLTQTGGIQLAELPPDSIVVARELLPSDLLEFDRENLAGIISESGGETGHAAILARALGVPAVTGIGGATGAIPPNAHLLVNGQTGEVALEPAGPQLEVSRADKARYEQATREAIEAEGRECITRDGVGVKLLANVGRPFEVQQVGRHHLDGIGLFRTEYLFLDQPAAPSLERQYEVYCDVAQRLYGKPLVIRTLDLGGDKWPAFLKPRFEANPNLGVRGLRYSLLTSQDLFRTQVRAVLLASRHHDVRLMFPMVIGRADLREAIAVVNDVAHAEGVREIPPIGALVETPSAIFAIDEILADTDFVGIGTNDLTQFLLAVDRNALALIDEYTVLHPSVLRAVHRVMEAADRAGRPVTVCGEAAADARVARLLVGLGARRLSMSPVSAARVRYAIRASSLPSLESLAQAALSSDSARSVSALVTEALGEVLPELDAGEITV